MSKKPWKRLTALLCLMAVFTIVHEFRPENEKSDLTIGSPGDAGGLVVYYLLRHENFHDFKVEKALADYPLSDCCANSAQWALSTDILDLAVLCPDAAKNLVAKDSRFQIWGPCLVNSDVIIQRPGKTPRKVGIMHGRISQEEYVKDRCGSSCITVPMLVSALPYAYERGVIDAFVIDCLKAFKMSGAMIPLAAGGRDQVTYVLVVRKNKVKSPAFKEFILAWNQASQEMEKPQIMKKVLAEYTGLSFQGKEVRMWSQLKIRFPMLQVPVISRE